MSLVYKDGVGILKLIADTSIIISVITNESTKTKLIELTQGCQLYAPISISWEIGNAISAMYKRKRLSKEEGIYIFNEYKNMSVSVVEIDLLRAIKLAMKYNIYAYDAYMIQCAKEQKATLITLDQKLGEIALHAGIKTIGVN